MTTLNLQIAAGTDEADEDHDDGTITLTGTYLRIGNYVNGHHCGWRWTGTSVLGGATINSAQMQFYAADDDTGAFDGDWYAHDAASPGTFTTTAYNISDTGQRPRTTATFEGDSEHLNDLDGGDWTQSVWAIVTGDDVGGSLKAVIQELADSYTPTAIAMLHIYEDGNGERLARSYYGGSPYGTNAPKLDIDYTAAADFGWFVQEPDVIRPPHQTRPGLLTPSLEPIAPPVVPDFGWFVQASEPVRVAPRAQQPIYGQPPVAPTLPPVWAGQDTIVFGRKRLQYQGKTEPLLPIAPPAVPDFGWFVQEPDVIRPPLRLVPGEAVLGQPPITPDFGWFVQEPDVIRPPRQTRPGLLGQSLEPIVAVAPDFGWFVQEPDVIRPLHQTRPGLAVLGQPPITPDFGWFVPPPDVIRPRHQVRPGLAVLGQPPLTPDFGWFVPPPDVIRPPHQVRPGLAVLGQPPITPDFGWFVQEPDVIRSLHQTRPGLVISSLEPVVPVAPDFGWFHQQTEVFPARPPYQIRPGLVVLGQPPIVPSFDWFVPPPDVIRLVPRPVPEGAFAFPILVRIPLIYRHSESAEIDRASTAEQLPKSSTGEQLPKTSIGEQLPKSSEAEQDEKGSNVQEGYGP